MADRLMLSACTNGGRNRVGHARLVCCASLPFGMFVSFGSSFRKGKPPPVKLTVVQRSGNKKVSNNVLHVT